MKLLGALGIGALLLTGIIRAGQQSARIVHDAAQLEADRLRAKVEAYELLHGRFERRQPDGTWAPITPEQAREGGWGK